MPRPLIAVLIAACVLATVVASGIGAATASAGGPKAKASAYSAGQEDDALTGFNRLGGIAAASACEGYATANDPLGGVCANLVDWLGSIRYRLGTSGPSYMVLAQLRNELAPARLDGECPVGSLCRSIEDTKTHAAVTATETEIQTAQLGDIKARLTDLKTYAAADTTKIDVLPSKLDQLHTDLDELTAAVQSQGPNTPGGATANGADDSSPMFVRLASADATDDTLESATLATREDLWFAIGLLITGLIAVPVMRRLFLP